jgi:hypothetical protein
MGIAPSMVNDPDATSITVMEVVAELLWMIAVINRPMNKPIKGFEVAKIIVSAAPRPICWTEEIMRSSEKRKISNAAAMYAKFRTHKFHGRLIGISGEFAELLVISVNITSVNHRE